MPQPTYTDVHVSAPLTDISVAYIQNAANFIAGTVFPVVPVDKQANKYYSWSKNDWFRDEAAIRAPGTESAGGGMGLTTGSYACDIWAYHKDIDDATRANSDPAVNVQDAATEFVTQKMLIRRELAWVSKYFGLNIWGTDKVGGTDFTKWDDAASDPEADIAAGKKAILVSTGFEANTLTVSYPVHQALKRHPIIKDRFKYTSSDSITDQMLARFFEVEQYLVAKAVYSSSAEGAAAPTYAFTHGSNALLTHTAPSPSLMVPSAGYTFVWRGLTGLNNTGTRIKAFRMENIASERIEGEFAFDFGVIGSDLGYFFSAATA